MTFSDFNALAQLAGGHRRLLEILNPRGLEHFVFWLALSVGEPNGPRGPEFWKDCVDPWCEHWSEQSAMKSTVRERLSELIESLYSVGTLRLRGDAGGDEPTAWRTS